MDILWIVFRKWHALLNGVWVAYPIPGRWERTLTVPWIDADQAREVADNLQAAIDASFVEKRTGMDLSWSYDDIATVSDTEDT